MNKVILIGRLTRDPEVRYSKGPQGDSCVAKFSIAVDRRRTSPDGAREADFISCTAFGKSAEFLGKYFTKGMKIGVTGRIQTGSYVNKDNQKVYTTDIVCDELEFVESRSQGGQDSWQQGQPEGRNYSRSQGQLYGGDQGGFGGAPSGQASRPGRMQESEIGRGFMDASGFGDDQLPFGD